MSLAGNKLLDLCNEYPDYGRYMVFRATQRRSYFIKVLNEIENEVELQLKEAEEVKRDQDYGEMEIAIFKSVNMDASPRTKKRILNKHLRKNIRLYI